VNDVRWHGPLRIWHGNPISVPQCRSKSSQLGGQGLGTFLTKEESSASSLNLWSLAISTSRVQRAPTPNYSSSLYCTLLCLSLYYAGIGRPFLSLSSAGIGLPFLLVQCLHSWIIPTDNSYCRPGFQFIICSATEWIIPGTALRVYPNVNPFF